MSQTPSAPPSIDPASRFTLALNPAMEDYALLDCGHGRKLERFGGVLVDRPEPQAMAAPSRPDLWKKADAVFDGRDDEEQGRWRYVSKPDEAWTMALDGLTLECRFSPFRHMGIFPEQYSHWQWMAERLRGLAPVLGGEKPRLLNLFAYTGVASLLAAQAGAEVTHVDASKKAITWAKRNQELSRMENFPIRWIVEDARRFVDREVRRGRSYHGILVDPPKFGRGPDGEVWEFFEHMPQLLASCAALLAEKSFLVLTSYAIRASCLALDDTMRAVLKDKGGHIVSGELALESEHGGRVLGTSLYSRWENI